MKQSTRIYIYIYFVLGQHLFYYVRVLGRTTPIILCSNMNFVAFECNLDFWAKQASIAFSERPTIRFMYGENIFHGGGSHKQLQNNKT